MNFRNGKKLTSFQVIVYGFALVILTGSLFLMLPMATRDGQGASFLDAIFTSTSAVCVTGLVVHDTATYWSAFGQTVIILLIQIGGMGVVTVAAAVTMVSGRKIGLMQRSTMQEAIAAPKMGGIVRLTGFVLKATLVIELIGAAAMSQVFVKEYGLVKGIGYSLFHSISAFCNAGFDLMGEKEAFSSLISYQNNPVINITIMLLIIIGGIGFLTWDDIRTNRFHFHKYRMQSKVILTMTSILLLLPALYFFFFEFADISAGERVWVSLFQSVTPRTAGFNTADLTLLSEVGQMIMILLMLTGGAPGSTAGGMKVTTAGPWLFPRTGMTKEELRKMVDDQERAVAEWVAANGKRAGCCTHTLPGAKAMYLPIKTSDKTYAVMGIVLEERREIPAFEYGLLTAMVNEAALVFARILKEKEK